MEQADTLPQRYGGVQPLAALELIVVRGHPLGLNLLLPSSYAIWVSWKSANACIQYVYIYICTNIGPWSQLIDSIQNPQTMWVTRTKLPPWLRHCGSSLHLSWSSEISPHGGQPWGW
jgi:hypothetical protein